MSITDYSNEHAILIMLGNRLKQYRVASNITQSQLAQMCGITERTINRIEHGEDTKLSNLIKIMIMLGISENLDLLVPEEEIDYEALFKSKPQKKHASAKSQKAPKPWVWNEDK